jgi:hypothetical protein
MASTEPALTHDSPEPDSSPLQAFAASLTTGMGMVSARFVEDMLVGIQRSRSLKLTDISRSLDEDIEHHATHKRLSRNLARADLTAQISERLLQQAVDCIGHDSRLAIHYYDIHKKYARKMQYLLPDQGAGSGPHAHGGEYTVCEIIAADPGANVYVPLTGSVWSRNAPDFVSDGTMVMCTIDAARRILADRGVFYFHQRVPSAVSIEDILQMEDLRFVAMPDSRTVLNYRNTRQSIEDIMAAAPTPYGKTLFKLVNQMEMTCILAFGASPVRPTVGPSRPLSLVTLSSRLIGDDWQEAESQSLVPLLTSEVGPGNRQELTELIENNSSILDFVTVRGRHEASFDMDFRVQTYQRLQLLMTLLRAVMYFESVVERQVPIEITSNSFSPHEGEHTRDFLLPEAVRSAESLTNAPEADV